MASSSHDTSPTHLNDAVSPESGKSSSQPVDAYPAAPRSQKRSASEPNLCQHVHQNSPAKKLCCCANETTPLLSGPTTGGSLNAPGGVSADAGYGEVNMRGEGPSSGRSSLSSNATLAVYIPREEVGCNDEEPEYDIEDDLGELFRYDLDRHIRFSDIWAEVKALIPLSWPVSAGYLLRNSIFIAAVFSLGRHSTQALASMALCTLFCNVTGFSIGIGMASALDTLCSQAYGEALKGKLHKHELGRHLQRGLLVLFLLSIPISVLWCFTDKILILVGQSPEIAMLAGRFVRCMIPGLYPYFVGEAVKRYLQAQGIMSASMVIIGLVSPVNVVLQYVLVWSPIGLGEIGAPIAISISYGLLALLMILYVLFVKGGECWGGIEPRELFRTYMLPLGFAIAATTRIGNALGAACPYRARVSALSALIIGQILALGNSTLLMLVKNQWGLLWTDEPAVVKLVAEVLPLAAVFQLSDATGAISGGILRGIGRQEIGAYLNIVGYYLVGLPFGFYACFRLNFQLFGLWLGLTMGLIIVSIIQVVIILKTDWPKEAARTHELICAKEPLLHGDDLEGDGGSGARTPVEA
ncbi:hypothetical protein HDU96_006301 [Phlyctochytrium bullatum]|nr:hypothetical protein HDU96_006301 [Phlyctochytrium bullatum]